MLAITFSNWAIYKVWLFCCCVYLQKFLDLDVLSILFFSLQILCFLCLFCGCVLSFGAVPHDGRCIGEWSRGSKWNRGWGRILAKDDGLPEQGGERRGRTYRHSRGTCRVRWEDVGKGKGFNQTRDAHWVDSDSGALGQRRFLDLEECCSAKCQMLFSGELLLRFDERALPRYF